MASKSSPDNAITPLTVPIDVTGNPDTCEVTVGYAQAHPRSLYVAHASLRHVARSRSAAPNPATGGPRGPTACAACGPAPPPARAPGRPWPRTHRSPALLHAPPGPRRPGKPRVARDIRMTRPVADRYTGRCAPTAVPSPDAAVVPPDPGAG